MNKQKNKCAKGLICDTCGKVIECYRDTTLHHHFCNNSCYSEWQRENKIGENNINWKGGWISLICDGCGKVIEKPPSHVADNNFCSVKCRWKWAQEHKMLGEKNPNWKGGLKYMTCDNCGKIIERKVSRINNTNCCSMKCKGELSSKDDARGIKISSTWQGIPYEEWDGYATEERYCEKFDEACRERIRAKYGCRCFICNRLQDENITKTGKVKKLSVHHVDKNKEQGCDGIAWNLVPVCMHCHAMTHMTIWETRITWLLENVYVGDDDE